MTKLYEVALAYREGNQPELGDSFDFETERKNRSPRFLQIVSAYEKNVPIKDIIEEHKCSRNTVLRYARMAGLPKREKHFDDSIRTQAITLLKAGAPLKEIAKTLKVSEAYVSLVAKDNGLSRRKKSTSQT